MIYTITLNPSIDYVVYLNSFSRGTVNRTVRDSFCIGGKGINVSLILSELGIESSAMGFTAGFTGEAIEKGLENRGIRADFVKAENGISRINVKLKAEEDSEINGQGPLISERELGLFMKKTDIISDGDTVVIAGSIPKSLSENTYEKILERLKNRKVHTVIDAEKNLLLNALKYRPFLIKPNRQELSEIFGAEIKSYAEAEAYARRLQEMGAKNVIVSLDKDGAFMVDEFGKSHKSGIIDEKIINTVGSGDSMIAGFLAGYQKTCDYGYALTMGTACGNATAFSDCLATRETIEEAFRKLTFKPF